MSVNLPERFSDDLSFEQQLLYALSKLRKASVNELAIELTELKGTATEDGVADLALHTEKQLQKLCDQGLVNIVKERRQKNRYELANPV